MDKPVAAKTKKKIKRVVTDAIAHVQASFNNTDGHDHRSPGQCAVMGDCRWRRFPRLAQVDPVRCPGRSGEGRHARRREYGVKTLEVRIKGPGPGRESAVRSLKALG